MNTLKVLICTVMRTICANGSCHCSLCSFSAASAEDGGDAAAEEEGDHGRQGDPEPQVEGANSIEVIVDVAELNMFQALSVSHAKLLVIYVFDIINDIFVGLEPNHVLNRVSDGVADVCQL